MSYGLDCRQESFKILSVTVIPRRVSSIFGGTVNPKIQQYRDTVRTTTENDETHHTVALFQGRRQHAAFVF